GIGALLLCLAEEPRVRQRRIGLGIVAGTVAILFVNAAGNIPLLSPLDRLPRAIVPVAFRPLRDPAFHDVRALVMYLRRVAEPQSKVVVGASSTALNYDLLRNAEAALFPKRRLDFVALPQVDSEGVLPIAPLLSADFVITATPFQHH